MRLWTSTQILSLIIAASLPAAAAAQQSQSPPAAALLAPFEWRNIGPSNMMGRISSVDALNSDYRTVLVGAASGGVWKSTNAGVTFTPIFDEGGSQSIGDVAFFQPDPSIIWVGTGEATNRNSVEWGDGIYKSMDGGETFEHMGLRDTYQIAEIAPHPGNPDVVYVAALGNLWSYGVGRRGLFKTTDGGRTWTELTNGLPVNGRVGAVDVEIDPENPDIVYVGMYERLRTPWSMKSGGPTGGIFKSTDAGASWTELANGLPAGPTGMIDIDIYRDDPATLVAYIEASEELPRDMSEPGSGVYRSDDGGRTWEYLLRHTSRPYYHGNVRINPSNDDLIYVASRHSAYSTDGGETWESGKNWSSGGGDDHDMWISPEFPKVIYSATDQGAHLTLGGDGHISFTNMAIGQYYKIGVDMRDPYWIYGGLQENGGWGVVSNSRGSNGINIHHAVDVNGGDGFAMQVDPTDWTTVYTAVHVGYFARVDMETRACTYITPTPATIVNFEEYYDPDYPESQTLYTINPGEHWLSCDRPSRTINGSILPPQFRWNWNSPMVLSPTDPHTIYLASNYLFKSTDRGESWRIISPDLTRNRPATRNSTQSGGLIRDVTGAENHHTIFSIAPSPVDPDVIWAGTDDGLVHVTRDGGESWTNVTAAIREASAAPGGALRLPDTIWVSQVTASHFDEGTAYVAFDNHRMGDNAPYLFKTTDFGESWTDITSNLPRDVPGTVIYDIAADHENPNLLFLGTQFGVYVTLNRGGRWTKLDGELPAVAVRDLVIHPRADDLIAGTHGRSIWILDNINPLQQLTPEVLASDVHLFENRVATNWLEITDDRMRTDFTFEGENPPEGAAIDFYLASEPEDSVRVAIADVNDLVRARARAITTESSAGINRVRWDLRFPPGDEALSAQRALLARALAETARLVEETDQHTEYEVIEDDLLSKHYPPDPYKEFDYPSLDSDSRTFLLAHLEAIGAALDEAESARELARVRTQLMQFSSIVGDEAFFGFYGEPRRPVVAPAGDYRVRITVDGETYTGTVTVREDPLVEEGGGEVAARPVGPEPARLRGPAGPDPVEGSGEMSAAAANI